MTRLFEAKPFIVAEVGSNHLGAQEAGRLQCLHSIEVAKSVGADAVKFQAFTAKALYGIDSGALTHELPLEWLPQLKAKADACGIEFMCTAFSPELVAAVDPFVEVHKVASSDAAWPQMLEAVARTGKPILLSSGAKCQGEIDDALGQLESWRNVLGTQSDVVLLQCVANYPADFMQIYPYDRNECRFDGISDHTLGYSVAVAAAQAGAEVIEKHFTAFPDIDTPDRPHSLTPSQFRRMVDIIRGHPTESEETAMFKRHNRRLVATRDVLDGELLEYGVNFGAYRSLVDDERGLSPFDWERVEGKAATREIARGASIGEGDFA